LQRLVSVLNETLSSAFAQGDNAEDVLIRRLRERLTGLAAGSRRAMKSGALVVGVCVAALAVMSFAVALPAWQRGVASLGIAAVMGLAIAGMLEASKLITLVDALQDLLMTGDSMGRLDIVFAFRDRLRADIGAEPDWTKLAAILSDAYDTTASARMVLLQAGIPAGVLDLNQPMLYLWLDALRVARRRDRLGALFSIMLADSAIAGYHGPLREQRARLGV
jgi:hypothetical protein